MEIAAVNRSIAVGGSPGLRRTSHVSRAQLRGHAERLRQSGAAQPTEAEKEELRELRKRDREVRRHEQAHKAAAGPHANGGPRYEFVSGPDGRLYAVSGSVEIDTAPVPDDPEATLRKMRQVRRAALAPAEPSAEDRAVAAEASREAAAARAELREDEGGEGRLPGAADAYAAAGRREAAGIDLRA